MLLEWNKDLIKQAERSTGSTALHFAASSERAAGPIISLLLAAGPSLAYQPDNNGSFPIHVAAIADRGNALYTLLHGCHDCAELRDAKGGTFLHVAVVEESSWGVIEALNDDVSFIGNMQDNDGNTALHLAVQVGNQYICNKLMVNRLVKLNLTNNKGQTPLDLSWDMLPIYYGSVSNQLFFLKCTPQIFCCSMKELGYMIGYEMSVLHLVLAGGIPSTKGCA